MLRKSLRGRVALALLSWAGIGVLLLLQPAGERASLGGVVTLAAAGVATLLAYAFQRRLAHLRSLDEIRHLAFETWRSLVAEASRLDANAGSLGLSAFLPKLRALFPHCDAIGVRKTTGL